ncbi:hypothetical protein TWF481_000018 [Arthrobotrys musiformis]|uniref:Glycosyltransferase 2-like domain-containing protein n=1 Tax=Arthrobotrys musiformis TaxID=47236 RepID=A0AAV9WS30_9PEZI
MCIVRMASSSNDSFLFVALCLLWIHSFTTLFTALFAHLTIKSIRGKNSSSRQTSNFSTGHSNQDIVLRVIASILEAVTQICVVESLFQTRSIVLPMLFYYMADVIVHVIQLAYLRFRPTSTRGVTYTLLTPILLTVPFAILIFLAERKLSPFGLVFLFIGVGSYVFSASIKFYQDYNLGLRLSPKMTATRDFKWPSWLTIVFTLVGTSILIVCGLEGLILISRGGLQKLKADLHPVFLIPSIVLGILNALEGSESRRKESNDLEDFESADSQADYATSRATMDAVAVFVCTFLLFLQTPTWIQLISYGIIAIANTLIVFIFCQSININTDLHQVEIAESENVELEDYSATRKLLDSEEIITRRKKLRLQGSYYSFVLKLWILFASLLGTKLLLERSSSDKGLDGTFFQIPTPGSLEEIPKMDVVISYFKEDLKGVQSFLQELKSIPQIRQLDVNILIYTKNNESNLAKIRSLTMANDVIELPNEGREGGTYLHHILNRWGALANHTLFIQAEPHSRSQVLDRIKLYFDPFRTGMLDLGHRELRGCKCLDCRDEYSWSDTTGLIPDLMAQAHHIKCDENTQVATSYKGQFLVSSKRIRAAKRSLYETLNDKLVGKDRVLIGDPQVDRIDAPIFGYSLERSWNVIFQCADLTGVRDMCPGLTLLGTNFGDFNDAHPGDCGCLDE